MSSGHGPRRDDRSKAHQENHAPDESAELEPDVLSEIVAETAAQLASAEPADPALHAALTAVARQHIGQPMTAETTGAALLAAVLQHQFPFLSARPILLARAAKTVAESLLADLSARRRLEHLWAKLLEEVS